MYVETRISNEPRLEYPADFSKETTLMNVKGVSMHLMTSCSQSHEI